MSDEPKYRIHCHREGCEMAVKAAATIGDARAITRCLLTNHDASAGRTMRRLQSGGSGDDTLDGYDPVELWGACGPTDSDDWIQIWRRDDSARQEAQARARILRAATCRIGPRDFARFARRCAMISEGLGVVVRLHSEAADGNSPDVARWVETTCHEWVHVRRLSPAQAQAWWHRTYRIPHEA